MGSASDDGIGHPPARRMLDGRHRRSCIGTVPTPKGGGLVPFESLLEGDLIMGSAKDPDVVGIRAQPETFRWVDGATGRRRRYTPDLLVTLRDGSTVYREVKPHAVLVRDPELKVRRRQIEAECLLRGASFEVWTEREIRQAPAGRMRLRPATLEEARLHAEAHADPSETGSLLPDMAPDRVREFASLVPVIELLLVGGVWIGRSGLTGILTVLLDDATPRRAP